MIESAITLAVERAIAPLRDELRFVRAEIAKLSDRDDVREPLADILGLSRGAAAQRVSRDPELRRLGVRSGRQLLFVRAAVFRYLETKKRSGSR